MIDIEELIPSKDVREYMEKKGRALTGFEIAKFVYNHLRMSFEDKKAKHTVLMQTTEELKLKNQIKERLDYDEQFIKDFFKRGKNEFYRASICEKGKNAKRIYYTYAEGAVEKIKKFHKPFFLYKVKFVYDGRDLLSDDFGDLLATLYFNEEGILYGYTE